MAGCRATTQRRRRRSGQPHCLVKAALPNPRAIRRPNRWGGQRVWRFYRVMCRTDGRQDRTRVVRLHRMWTTTFFNVIGMSHSDPKQTLRGYSWRKRTLGSQTYDWP
jgi:hypothetical protein